MRCRLPLFRLRRNKLSVESRNYPANTYAVRPISGVGKHVCKQAAAQIEEDADTWGPRGGGQRGAGTADVWVFPGGRCSIGVLKGKRQKPACKYRH